MTVNMKVWRGVCFGLILLVASRTSVAEAADVPIVGGTLWAQSSNAEKISYLVGISNFLDVEYAYQIRNANPPSDEQSIVRRLYEDVDEESLDDVIGRVDAWYAANPNRPDKAVLDVIWTEYFEK